MPKTFERFAGAGKILPFKGTARARSAEKPSTADHFPGQAVGDLFHKWQITDGNGIEMTVVLRGAVCPLTMAEIAGTLHDALTALTTSTWEQGA